jgi:hypothetical protein
VPRGYVAQRAAEFEDQVPFYRIFTETASPFPSETDGTAGAGDGDVVPEGFVRAYTQELQNKTANHGNEVIDDRNSAGRNPKDVDLLKIGNGSEAEVLAHCTKILYHNDKSSGVTEECEESFRVVESMLPAAGFAGGLDYPTALDMAVLNMVTSYELVGKTKNGDALSQYPKIKALAQATAAARAMQSPGR